MTTDQAGDVPSLVRALVASDPGRPRVTWYGTDGERVELSARVLENWVAKTANMLVEECDAGPGSVVTIDLPPHWRTVVWALATWSVGADLSEPGRRPGGPRSDSVPDVVVTAAPATAPAGGLVVGVTLAALARRFEGKGDVDVDDAAEVSTFADSYDPAGPLDQGDLLERARTAAQAAGWPDGVRLLVRPGTFDTVTTVLAALVRDGSVVITHGDPAERVSSDEQVTATT